MTYVDPYTQRQGAQDAIPVDEIRALLNEAGAALERAAQMLEALARQPERTTPDANPAPRLSPESRRRLGALLPVLYRLFGGEEFKLSDAWASLAKHPDPAAQAAMQGMSKHEFGLRLAWAARASAGIGQAAWGLPFVVLREGLHHHSRRWRVHLAEQGASQ